MNVLYYYPYPNSLNSGRTIYYGYKNAFETLGHNFYTLNAHESYEEVLEKVEPHIFIWSVGSTQNLKEKITIINKYRQKGMKVFVQIPFWNHSFGLLRINESKSLKDNMELISLIKSGEVGDYFYNSCDDIDERMNGFEKTTNYKHISIPLAADKNIIYDANYKNEFKADISYIGTLLPEKKAFFKDNIMPLRNQYNIKLYGQDWTTTDKVIGLFHKFGMYYNIPFLKDLRKQRLELSDEGDIYRSTKISINIHEEYQKKFGGDCNERTFKIPLAGGFEIVDNVRCIKKYFNEKEMVIADNPNDYKEKLQYYLKNPDKCQDIIEAGRKRVLRDHTYERRVEQMLGYYHEDLK